MTKVEEKSRTIISNCVVCYKNKSSFVNCFNIADVIIFFFFIYIIHFVPIINSFHTHHTLDNTIWYTNIFWYKHIAQLCNIYQYVYVVCVCSDAIWSNMLLIPHSICEWENLLIFIVDWILIYCQTKPTTNAVPPSPAPTPNTLTLYIC